MTLWNILTSLRDRLPECLCPPIDWLRYSKWIYPLDHGLELEVHKTRREIINEIQKILTDEISIAHTEGTPTSRLTSAYMRIDKL